MSNRHFKIKLGEYSKTIFLFLFCITLVSAQFLKEPALSDLVLKELRSSLKLDSSDTALMNALTNNELHRIALNRKFMMSHNKLFTKRIENKDVTDQKNSGRCWIFAGLNVLRPKVIKRYNLKTFEFSQSYISFYDKLEKANFLLEFIIQTRDRDLMDRELVEIIEDGVQDGGYWQWFVALVKKYGVVPKEVFPETNPSSNTWLMTQLLDEQVLSGAGILRQMAKNGADETELRAFKLRVLKNVYKVLVMNFTEPPEKFVWRYEDKDGKIFESKKYTPQEFFKEVVGVDLKNYVSLIDYPGREYNQLYQFDNCRNVFDAPNPRSANVNIALIKEVVKKSILNDEPVWFACDIGKECERENGILSSKIFDYDVIFKSEFKMNKEMRIFYRNSSANHAMVLLGVDVVEDRPIKWLVENSHGKDEGDEGFYIMYDDWFDDYVYEVIIDIKYLPEEIKKIFQQEPIHLPIWDPMAELLRVK
uniref:Aminopeptidase n=1 Tax=candidate division WOR-3 bacterium TaxID=2052148 RepID=A0A7C4TBI1_UNCW3